MKRKILCLCLALIMLLSVLSGCELDHSGITFPSFTGTPSTNGTKPSEPSQGSQPTDPAPTGPDSSQPTQPGSTGPSPSQPTQPGPTGPDSSQPTQPTQPGPTGPQPELPWESYPVISVEMALHLAMDYPDTPSSESYYCIVTIGEVINVLYGELMVYDDTGSIYVYGSGVNGKDFYTLNPQPKAGDMLLLYGTLRCYNGIPEFDYAQILGHKTADGDQDPPPDDSELNWDQYDCITIAEALERSKQYGDGPSQERYYIVVQLCQVSHDYYYGPIVYDETGWILVDSAKTSNGIWFSQMNPAPQIDDYLLLYTGVYQTTGYISLHDAIVVDHKPGEGKGTPGTGPADGSNGLEYAYYGLYYSVTGIGTCTDRDIVIPSVYDGLPVAAIERSAFTWVYDVDSVTIPDSVTQIGSSAFSNNGIKRVRLPEGLETIPENLFAFSDLEEIQLPSSVKVIEDFAFYGCDRLTKLELHEGITYLGEWSLCMTALRTIVIPRSITKIQNYTFNSSTIESITIPDTIEYIGYGAFKFSVLKSIRFEGSLPRISNYAFDGVTAQVEYPAGNATWHTSVMLDYGGDLTYTGYASDFVPWLRFERSSDGSYYILTGVDDPNLTQIVVPYMYNGLPVRAIADYAFAGCRQITSIQMPGALQTVGASAFSGCGNLREVVFTGGMPHVAADAFAGVTATAVYPKDDPTWSGSGRKPYGGNLNWKASDWSLEYYYDPITEAYSVCGIGNFIGTYLVIPQYYEGKPVRNINQDIFRYCQYLETVIISDLVGKLEAELFADCINLQTVQLPANLKLIEYNVFSNCVSLRQIQIPGKVTDIESEAFAGCVSLEQVILSDSLEIIWDRAFYGCESLQQIDIPDSVREICDSAFANCASLQSVRLPAGLTLISYNLFENCTSLRSITLPTSVTEIRDFAFAYCPLEQIQFHEGLERIGVRAFSHCDWLQALTFPKSLKYIGADAFDYCTGVSVITFLGDKPYMPDGFDSPFKDVVATVYYPAGNATWVGMHNYEGVLTWMPKEFP